MEWEEKTELIRLGNKNYRSDDDRKEFQDYCLKHVDNFDLQAWDMFSNIVEISENDMKKDVDFWTKIFSKLKEIDCNNEKLSFRSGMRIAMIQTMCEEKLKLI